jgi:hypothetical protein
MTVIENFAVLPEKEQREFAEALLKTINSEGIFTSDTDFELTDFEADEITGGLWIAVINTTPIEVPRKATWTCNDEEDIYSVPNSDFIEYENRLNEDVAKAFNTLTATLEGYTISLEEVADSDEIKKVDVEIDKFSHEDSGIGAFDFGGHIEYDSQPYIEVTGNIITSCDCSLAFFVEPNDTIEVEPEITEEN